MYELEFTREAEADLTNAIDYIAVELDNPSASMALLAQLNKTLNRLCRFPEMGALLKFDFNYMNYRFVRCKNYLVFYHVENNTVKIDHIIHGRRDYMRIIFGEYDEDDDFPD